MRKIIVLTCILSILVPAVLLAGCGGSGGSSSATPEGAAKAFWTAALKGDSDASWGMLSKSLQTLVKSKAEWAKIQNTSSPTATVEVGKATIKGSTATVKVTVKNAGTAITTSDVSLEKEGGAWKIAMP